MDLLGERPAWSMNGSELLTTIDHLDAELARLETYRLHLIARLDDTGYAAEIGAHDTAQLLEFRYRQDRSRARRDLRLATALSKYGAVAAALPIIDPPTTSADAAAPPEVLLRPAQAEAIVAALEQVPTTVAIADVDVAEQELVGLARNLCPAELRKAGQRARDILDTDGPEPEEHQAYARESLTLTTADRGVKFRGYLANDNAELLRTLIHTAARPHKTLDGEPDPRTREKRQADALTTVLTLAATALDTATTGTTAPPSAATSPRTHSSRTAASGASASGVSASGTGTSGTGTPETNASEAGASGTGMLPIGASGTAETGSDTDRTIAAGTDTTEHDAAGRVPGFGAKANITVTIDLQDLKAATADAIGDTVYGDGLSAAAIRRLACDARIIPVVLGSNSEPLDVGRSERLVTRAMRRALNTRDKGCVVCGAPPIHCDAHHLVSWINGGETKVSNLVLLCRRHHIDLHAGHWLITITSNQVHVARPTWADPPRNTAPRQPSPTAPNPGAAPRQRPTTGLNPPGPSRTPQHPGPATQTLSAPSPSEPNTSAPREMDAPSSALAAPTRIDAAANTHYTSVDSGSRGGTSVNEARTTAPTAAASLRESACLAIWGEPAIPLANRRTNPDSWTTPDDRRFDPWDESSSVDSHAAS